MGRAVGVVVGVALVGLAFGAGRMSVPEPEPPPEVVEPDWRLAVSAARMGADAQSARAAALDLLDEAESDAALVHAVELLAPVAAPDDIALLDSLVRSGDPRLTGPAVEALGLIATPPAVAQLTEYAALPETRSQALLALGATGAASSLGPLVDALDDEHHTLAAASGLALLGTDAAARALIVRLDRGDIWTSAGIARQLARFPADCDIARDALLDRARAGGPRANLAWSALAQVQDPRLHDILAVRIALGDTVAVTALSEMNDLRAVTTLADIVDRGGPMALQAIDGLAMMPHSEARSVVVELIRSERAAHAQHAISLVQGLHTAVVQEALVDAATGDNHLVAAAARERLFTYAWGSDAPLAVIDLARDPTLPPSALPATMRILLQHGDHRDHRFVLESLENATRQVRASAMWSLGDIHTRAATELLARFIADPDPSIASQAVQVAIGRGGLEPVIEAHMLELLESDPSQTQMAASALVQIHSARGIAVLEQLVTEGTEQQTYAAVSTLMSTGSPEVAGRLLVNAKSLPVSAQAAVYQHALYAPGLDPTDVADRILAHGDESLHHLATDALASAGTPRATERLVAMSHDEATRDSALYALGAVGGPEAEARLRDALSDPDGGSAALSALAGLGTRDAQEAVREAALNGPPELRAQALGSITNDRHATEIYEATLLEDDPTLQSVAISGLGSLGTPDSEALLVELLEDPDLGHQAASVLQMNGGGAARAHRDTIEALLGGTHDTGIAAAQEVFLDLF